MRTAFYSKVSNKPTVQCTVVEFNKEGVTKLFQKDYKAVQWICYHIW